jgi:hypothetical protein
MRNFCLQHVNLLTTAAGAGAVAAGVEQAICPATLLWFSWVEGRGTDCCMLLLMLMLQLHKPMPVSIEIPSSHLKRKMDGNAHRMGTPGEGILRACGCCCSRGDCCRQLAGVADCVERSKCKYAVCVCLSPCTVRESAQVSLGFTSCFRHEHEKFNGFQACSS